MLLIHLADVHIRKSLVRYNVYSEVFENLFEKVDTLVGDKMFVICGDIMHDRNTLDAYVIQLFFKLMKGLARRGKVIIIQGNHDHHPSHADETAPYDILGSLCKALDLAELVYLDQSGSVELDGIQFSTVTIHDASDTGDVRANALKDTLPRFPPPSKTTKCRVALWHGGISSCRYGNLSIKSKGVSLNWFEGYDIALLGDIHLQQIGNHITDTNTDGQTMMKFSTSEVTWGYPGSLIQQDHGEQLWGHGFLVWDLLNSTVAPVHIACPEGYVTLRGSDLFYDQRWTPLSKHLADADFPKSLRIRNVGGSVDETKVAMEMLNSKHIEVQSMSGLSNNIASATRSTTVDTSEYVRAGGCLSLLEKHGLSVEGIISDSVLQKFSNSELDKHRVDRHNKLEKLLSKFRDVKGVSDTVLSLGLLRWNWILSFRDNNETRVFSDEGLTVLHAPNGSGKTALLETLYLSLYGEGFPSRTTKDDSASFINDSKPDKELAMTELEFAVGVNKYVIVRRWNKVSDKAVVKEASLRRVEDDQRQTVIHKGRVEVDKWIAHNVCQGFDFLAGIVLTQANDSDFVSMSPREQCAMINRAFSLDALDALYDYLHESKNSMNYLLAQIPKTLSPSTGSEDVVSLREQLSDAIALESSTSTLLEQLPPRTKPPSEAMYTAALDVIAASDTVDDLEITLTRVEKKLATLQSIVLPFTSKERDTEAFAGSFGEAKSVVDAQVRLQLLQDKTGWTLSELRQTAEIDMKRVLDVANTADVQSEVHSSQELKSKLTRDVRTATLRLNKLNSDIASNESDLASAQEYEKTTVSRILLTKATAVRESWTSSSPHERACLMLSYVMSTAPELLPSPTTLLESGFTPKDDFWAQDFDTCGVALQMPIQQAARSVKHVRASRSTDEINQALRTNEQQRSDLTSTIASAENSLIVVNQQLDALERKLLQVKSEARDVSRCKRRMEALSAMETCVTDIATHSVVAAKDKFVKETARLNSRLQELRTLTDAHACVSTYKSEAERCRLKETLRTVDLVDISKRLGSAEAQSAWQADETVIVDYRRRLGNVLQALVTLKDIKDNVYTEYVLPAICQRVNSIISCVDSTIGVYANMDKDIIKWYAVISGRKIRIKRASGFQQFIVALGIRVELGSMIRPCRTVLIDEGFTTCDSDHILKIPVFLDSLISKGKFNTILLVTHIEALQNGVANTLTMRKGERMCV